MKVKAESTLNREGLWFRICGPLCAIVAGVLLLTAVAHAQNTRKLKSSPAPEYPELARRLGIKGTARVLATVAPDGSVKDVKELGGNPVLLAALAKAVKTWKYEPASQTSAVEVKMTFGGGQ